MRKYFVCILVVLLICGVSFAQDQDSTKSAQTAQKKSSPSRVYYGGTLGLSFGSYSRISIAPLVGYILSPKTSVGAKIGYEYINDSRNDYDQTYHNYGGSVFFRYRAVPQVYIHTEFAYMSYKWNAKIGDTDVESDRTWVPFLLMGAGYVYPVSPGASLFVEVLFDVLQDPNSPYEKGTPWISIGVGVGF